MLGSLSELLACGQTILLYRGSLLLQPTLFYFPSGIQLRNIGLIINNGTVVLKNSNIFLQNKSSTSWFFIPVILFSGQSESYLSFKLWISNYSHNSTLPKMSKMIEYLTVQKLQHWRRESVQDLFEVTPGGLKDSVVCSRNTWQQSYSPHCCRAMQAKTLCTGLLQP